MFTALINTASISPVAAPYIHMITEAIRKISVKYPDLGLGAAGGAERADRAAGTVLMVGFSFLLYAELHSFILKKLNRWERCICPL